MAKQAEIKRKVWLLKQQGIGQLITDVIKLADTLLLEVDEGTDEEYAKVSQKLIVKLKEQYKGQLIESPVMIQRDIEDVIQEIYDEAKQRYPQTLKEIGDD